MLEDRIQEHGLSNGRDRSSMPGLGNTNPVVGLGPTLGRLVEYSEKEGLGWRQATPEDLLQPPHKKGTVVIYSPLGSPGSRFGVLGRASRPFRPKGQVVLFKKVMEDWAFDKSEAASLLGFENAADIGEVYAGAKPIGFRDANDRLRTVLRIATDLDALFKGITPIRDWLGEAQSDLNGVSPRALLIEGSMENLLRVKYYVAYLSGR
jgi:hypothetical protein